MFLDSSDPSYSVSPRRGPPSPSLTHKKWEIKNQGSKCCHWLLLCPKLIRSVSIKSLRLVQRYHPKYIGDVRVGKKQDHQRVVSIICIFAKYDISLFICVTFFFLKISSRLNNPEKCGWKKNYLIWLIHQLAPNTTQERSFLMHFASQKAPHHHSVSQHLVPDSFALKIQYGGIGWRCWCRRHFRWWANNTFTRFGWRRSKRQVVS